ncbi:MAG TPA: acetylxylan esterase [Opitutaceae bacterium]|nr:acetylxylan esterase [Opitutaceae bacterium]
MQARWLMLPLLLASPARAELLTPARAADLRTGIRTNFFVPVPLPALEAKTQRTFFPAAGVKAEAVTYTTQLGMRVPAILYLPEPLPAGGKKIPAFIVVNGHGGDKYAWYAFYSGIAYARAGMAVLTYDQAGEGERSGNRKSGTREHDRLVGDEILARRLAGLMITDVMQAVSLLAARPEIDASRIGAAGYSMGSFVLAVAGAVETRLRACVLVGGGNLDGPDGYWDRSKAMCQGHPYRSLAFLGDRPAMLYALHAARGPLLIWNGRADSVVNMPKTQDDFFDDLRARTIAAHGKAEGVFEFGFVPATSHRPYFVTRPVALWLERQLDLPRFTAASLHELPETHISEWVAMHGIAVDNLYATEEREGGTRGIGTGVPGYERESLSVFSRAEWEREKSRLTFDAWTAAARRAATP